MTTEISVMYGSEKVNGIKGWCIGLHVDCHSSREHRTALQIQKAIYMIYDHLT